MVFPGIRGAGKTEIQFCGTRAQHPDSSGPKLPPATFRRETCSRPASPPWARQVEALAFSLAALLVLFGLPRIPARRSSSIPLRSQGNHERRRRSRNLPRPSLFVPLICSVVLAAAGVSAYFWGHMLLDPATPIAGIAVLYGLMLSVTLVATDLQRREIAARLATERESAARVAGGAQGARALPPGGAAGRG